MSAPLFRCEICGDVCEDVQGKYSLFCYEMVICTICEAEQPHKMYDTSTRYDGQDIPIPDQVNDMPMGGGL